MRIFFIGIYALFIVFLNSCGVNSNLMFREPKGAKNSGDSLLKITATEYVLQADDRFTFQLYTNNGEEIVNAMSGVEENKSIATPIEYMVNKSGLVDLPILGQIKLANLTITQCQDTLAKKYEEKNGYKDPYVQLKVTNLRVIVFPGSGSEAKVIPLQNSNTTLMEAIALSGGIADRGKANSVKLMRLENGERKVYTFDLSTIEGLKYADIIVQANDYIYIEPKETIAKESAKELAPIITIISSAFVLISVILTLN